MPRRSLHLISQPIWEAQPIAAHRKSNKFSTLKHHHTTRHDTKHHHEKYQVPETYDQQQQEAIPEEHEPYEQEPTPQIEEGVEEGPPLLTPDGLIVLDEIELWSHEEQESVAIDDMRASVFTSHLPLDVVDAIGRKLVLTRYAPSHVIYYTDQEADIFYIIRAGAGKLAP